MKHALWLKLLDVALRDPTPLTVIDTHAGAGLYDLQDDMARRSREAEEGVARLMSAPLTPAVLEPLKLAVIAENSDQAVRYYPGSPMLTVKALRRQDLYIGCELRADDQAALKAVLKRCNPAAKLQILLADGYAELATSWVDADNRRLCLIDPPFERGDEYQQIVACVRRTLKHRVDTTFAIWTPIKDLETLDALLRGLEALNAGPILVAETRLRPLSDPMRLNGSAMIMIGAPDISSDARLICEWVVEACGETGAAAQVTKLNPF